MQVGTELGGEVYYYEKEQDQNYRGKLLVDMELTASGLMSKDDVIIGQQGIYQFDRQGDAHIILYSPSFDKSADVYRPRELISDGPLA